MSITTDIAEVDVFTAMLAFLTSFLPTGTQVIQGQNNLAAMPLGGFVCMTSAGIDRLSTNVDTYTSSAQTKSILTPTRYDMQLDFYGPSAQIWCMQASALFRDQYATDNMPANIQPLYADNPLQMPLIDGEDQYEERWKLTASLQYNPLTTIGQQSALAVDIGLVEIDTTFKP